MLARELEHMTDHFTQALFAQSCGEAIVVRAPVSRLVVDVDASSAEVDASSAEVETRFRSLRAKLQAKADGADS